MNQPLYLPPIEPFDASNVYNNGVELGTYKGTKFIGGSEAGGYLVAYLGTGTSYGSIFGTKTANSKWAEAWSNTGIGTRTASLNRPNYYYITTYVQWNDGAVANASYFCGSEQQALSKLDEIFTQTDKYPITYYPTNVTLDPAPPEAAVGDTVTVSAIPDVGYGITDPASQILVTNNDVTVPYTWDAENQRITFAMPEGAVTVTVTASLIPTYPITYRPTRVTLDGPATAAVGATVNVDCTFPEGYGVKTTDSITVTCNRVPVPFSWNSENQRVTFTMPDPTGGGG